MRKLVRDAYYNLLNKPVLFYFIIIDEVDIIFLDFCFYSHKWSHFKSLINLMNQLPVLKGKRNIQFTNPLAGFVYDNKKYA